MEKRAMIALVLSLVVLVFWEYYFGLVRGPETPPQQESGQVAPTPSTPQSVPQTAPAAPPQAPPPQSLPSDQLRISEQSYQSWVIESALYDAKLLAPGGRISSFHLNKFRRDIDPSSPPMEMITSRDSGYLPLAVDLIHHQEWKLSTREFTSQSPGQSTLPADGQPKTYTYTTEVPNRVRVTKSLTFVPDSYIVDMNIQLQNLSSERLTDEMGISFYFAPYSGQADESSYNLSQLSVLQKGSISNHSLKDLGKGEVNIKPPMDWVAFENNFFIQAVVPLTDSPFQIIPKVLDPEKGLIQMVYLTEAFDIDSNQTRDFKLRLYIGPKELNALGKAEHNLTKAVDYGWFTFVAKPLLYVLNGIQKYVHNYGIAIILLTVLIKILFWPLTQKSYQSMQKMKKVQPKIAQIREKYKDDREKLNQELMGVYKTYKVNPMGGCLPMVLQIPVFFALYRMLNGAVELRHEPFMLWINDLTAPDRLHIGFDIPYLGGIPVLTLLMGITMFIQQKMTPTGGDPRQEQIMLLMPVMFTVFFINFPAGLVLYWLVNNVLSIVQQYWVNRHA